MTSRATIYWHQLELKDKVNWDYFILLVAKTGMRFSELIKQLPEDKPIFVDGAVYNSTVNNILARHCKECNIPVISIHGCGIRMRLCSCLQAYLLLV